MEIKELIKICEGHVIYLQTHNFPDPDAVASAYGLQQLLEHFNIHAQIIYDGRVEKLSTQKMFEVFGIKQIAYSDIKESLSEDNYIICVDSQKNGGNITDFTGNEIAAIDHHPTYSKVDYKYSDIRVVGACATIITDYYIQLGIEPSPEVATALVYGIRMDTIQLSRGVTIEDLAAYEYLYPLISKNVLNKLENNNMQLNDLKAYGAAIENIKIYGSIGFSVLPFECADAMIAILSDFILSLVEVKISIIYSVRKSGWKFSVRSEVEDVNAGSVIHNALEGIGNGGGHPQMAGGFVPVEAIDMLGEYPEEVIKQRFLDFIDDKYVV